jgi:PAS domain S-box-containing protein
MITGALIYFLVKKSYKKHEQINHDFKRLFEENPNPMWIYSIDDYSISLANKAACEGYGYAKFEFEQLSLFQLRPVREHESLKKLLQKSNMKEAIKDSGIWLHRRKNGEEFYVHIYSHFTRSRNQDCRIVSAIDVDDIYRSQIERDELTNRLKEYAFITSHDLRAPITRLMTLTDIYQNYKESELDFIIENIRKTSHELDQIIRKLNEQVEEELAIDLEIRKQEISVSTRGA